MTRIFTVRVNLDDMRASLDSIDGDADSAAWLRGFRAGVSGAPCRHPEGSPWQLGHAIGAASLAEASAYQEQKSQAGKNSARVRQERHGSAQPTRPTPNEAPNGRSNTDRTPIEHRSNTVPNEAPNETPNGSPNHPQSTIHNLEAKSEQPPARALTVDDQRREHLTTLGAIMQRDGHDIYPEWKAATKGLQGYEIADIFKVARPGITWPSEFKAKRAAVTV